MSGERSHEAERMRIQDEVVELRQRLELANRRIAELEASRDDLSAELKRARDERGELETRASELQGLLNRNPTTGLPIRRIFDTEFSRALHETLHQARGPLIAVGLLRLDHDYAKIKNYRDRTRALLFKTADRIRRIVGDNIYQSDRLDEFLLILRNMPNVDGVELRADQIVEAVSRPHEPPADDVRFGCYLGIAVHPQHGESREDLLGNADIALVESERNDKPFVIYDQEMGLRYREREYLEVELRNAIQAGFDGLALAYQPFFDREGRVRGSEALVRWTHDELGPVAPDRFIPIAEENGAIRFVGQWTLYRACRQLKLWHGQGLADLYVSVNLSPSQFKQIDLVERVGGILESLDLDGRFLTLEITETTVMEDPEEAIAKMRDLRSVGPRLAIDDFGTGYSSMSYLRRFEFDTLKIDRSFISGVHESPNDREIVKAIVAMSRAFGMQVLAEGVETREQLDFLLEQGCDLIQGYYHSAPLEPEALANVARRASSSQAPIATAASHSDTRSGRSVGNAAGRPGDSAGDSADEPETLINPDDEA
ncbi:MAG: putative bifunctional diguanylate cyclase/phosphodiesterase [Spirochaetota bacterium]